MADQHKSAKADGKAFDDFFDTIGNRAQEVQGRDKRQKTEDGAAPAEEDDQRVVDEIESLCMNCHANVCLYTYCYFLLGL